VMVGTSLLLLWTWSVGCLEGWVQRGCGEEISVLLSQSGFDE